MSVRTVLCNMGLVLQMAGIFMVLPIILSFVYNETSATIALFLAAMAFLVLGFLLNAFCEKVNLTFKQSSTLIVLVFVVMSVIGSIPYIYISFTGGSLFHVITDSIFESASGFTTTGFSVIPNLSSLPRSIIFYRALTQFVGGIGIVLVLLAFFYPEAKLTEFARGMGFGKEHRIKRTFLLILLIYFIYTIVLMAIGLIFGYSDIVHLVSFIFSALSTGGFAPINDITAVATQFPLNLILILGMILGAMNFFVLAGLFKGKVKAFLKSEITALLVIVAISVAVVIFFFKMPWFDALFHVVSAMSTTGFSYLSVPDFSGGLKLYLTFLMFVGGASFSTAGGIKVYRFLLMFKATRKAVVESITQKEAEPVTLFGRQYSNAELNQALVIVLLMFSIIFISTIIVSLYGFTPIDSLFETTSAIATTGLSTGIINSSLAVELKWLFVILMLLGRVEIFAFLIMFSRTKEPKNS
jgi:trk system potassium uptake protein TrkH